MSHPHKESRAKNDSVKKSVPQTKKRKELDPDKPTHWSHGQANYRCKRCGSNVRYRETTYTTPKGKSGRKKHVGLVCKDTIACRRTRKKLSDLERLLLDANSKALEQIETLLNPNKKDK